MVSPFCVAGLFGTSQWCEMSASIARINYLRYIAAYWDAESESYFNSHPEHSVESLHPSWGLWHLREDETRFVIDHIKLGCLMVDLGCGLGQDAVGYASRGATVIGIDISKAQLSRAIRHPNVCYVRSTAEKTPLPPNIADIVISDHGAFDHSPAQMLLPEVSRILKPGGILAFCTYSPLAFICYDKTTRKIGRQLLERHPEGNIKFDGKLVISEMSYSAWVNAFGEAGFLIERLEELIAPPGQAKYFDEMFDGEWGEKWPCDIVWVVRKPA